MIGEKCPARNSTQEMHFFIKGLSISLSFLFFFNAKEDMKVLHDS